LRSTSNDVKSGATVTQARCAAKSPILPDNVIDELN
jgi:hypothetical protein